MQSESIKLTEPNEAALDAISSAHWCRKDAATYGVSFSDIHQHNASNHTLSGTILIDGTLYGFIIESGDWNGTVVREWGSAEDVGIFDPGPPPELLAFIPNTLQVPKERRNFVALQYARRRLSTELIEAEKSYNYDRHFQPGTVIEKYYREKAKQMGLEVGLLSNLPKTWLDAIEVVKGKA